MDAGDLLYILFVIVSIVLGMLGKKKRKNRNTSTPSNEASQDVDWESLFENLSSGQRVKEEREVIHEEEPVSTFSEEPKKAENRPLNKTKSEKSKSKKPNIIFEEDVNEANSDFDLRQAIIYSEILKRPEY